MTDIEPEDYTIKVYRVGFEEGRKSGREEAAQIAERFPKNREWVPESLYDTLRKEVAQDIRKLK